MSNFKQDIKLRKLNKFDRDIRHNLYLQNTKHCVEIRKKIRTLIKNKNHYYNKIIRDLQKYTIVINISKTNYEDIYSLTSDVDVSTFPEGYYDVYIELIKNISEHFRNLYDITSEYYSMVYDITIIREYKLCDLTIHSDLINNYFVKIHRSIKNVNFMLSKDKYKIFTKYLYQTKN